MLDDKRQVIYVGKAKNLAKRLASYFNKQAKDPKTTVMLKKVVDVEFTVTRTEAEALLLEYELITSLKPRYNVIFRDDKSYPYIVVSKHQSFPRILSYRGTNKSLGTYFGPYPNTYAVRESLELLQTVFKLRNCNDTFFSNRSRPCLQYQIKRCTAPCVGYISEEDYGRDLASAKLFLQGKTSALIERLACKMQELSHGKNYEQAALVRDQIKALREVTALQIISDANSAETLDIVAVAMAETNICVHVLAIRAGRVLGSKSYFSKSELSNVESELIQNFVVSHYSALPSKELIPQTIIVPCMLADMDNVAELISRKHAKKIELKLAKRGAKLEWLEMAKANAVTALATRTKTDNAIVQSFNKLSEIFGFANKIGSVACFDVSHTQGSSTVASCVVFDKTGPRKDKYRRYKIKTQSKGDDLAAMHEALTRYLQAKLTKPEQLPDLLLIDGGKTQLKVAMEVAEALTMDLNMVSIAKGAKRKAGKEKLYLAPTLQEFILAEDDSSFHLLQRVRDEAHRFAITGHRKGRANTQLHSVLDDIEGIGKHRRLQLLKHFGGLSQLRSATIKEIAKVPGISEVLAQRVVAALKNDD